MLPYFFFLGIVSLFAYLANKHPNQKLWLILTLLVMVLFAGLRSSSVGTDSNTYAHQYLNAETPTGSIEDQITDEAGFHYLNHFLASISDQYWLLFCAIALITYSCVLVAIKHESNNIPLALFIFITLGLYTFVFNAARQGIAVGIYMLAFRYLTSDSKHGFIKYCLIACIAALFHKSVIITIPLYFLFRLRFSVKVLAIITILGVIIGFLLPSFLSFAATQEVRYQLYSKNVSGGEMLTIFYILITLFFILRRHNIDYRFHRRYDVFLNMMLFGTLIFVVVQLNNVYVELTRFAAYFQVSAIFLWLYTYASVSRPKPITSFFIILCHIFYFIIFCNKMAGLTPYLFNPNIVL